MNHWATEYIGLPHLVGGRDRNGVDCWGLFRLIYQEVFGIPLPEILGVVESPMVRIANIIQIGSDFWTEVDQPFDGCGVALSQKKAIHHVGIYADVDGGKIIHCWDSQNTIADTVRGLHLKGFRTIKFYRHFLWPS